MTIDSIRVKNEIIVIYTNIIVIRNTISTSEMSSLKTSAAAAIIKAVRIVLGLYHSRPIFNIFM